MAVPRGKEARLFYRCAKQRSGEARVLQAAFMPTGAVYLAGYSVECILKALIFSVVPLSNYPRTGGTPFAGRSL